MKKLSKVLSLIFALVLFLPFGCKKVDESKTEDENLQTEELAKIDSTYRKGVTKFEGFDNKPKIETLASQELLEKIKSNLERSYSKQVSYVKSAGNLVAVFKASTCGSFAELNVNMDCEDHNPASSSSGWTGASYVTASPYKNVILNFCVVDNQYFVQTDVDYAVLMLTTNLPSYVSRIARFFDNEDDSNGNWTYYNGSTFSGWFGDCWFGSDTRLSFYYYPHTTYQGFPSLGMDYGVLGRFGSNQGYIISDDEDTNNANWCWKDLWNGLGWTSGYSGNITNIMDVGGNTKLYFSKVAY